GTFYWLSVTLALFALPIHFSGEDQLGKAVHIKAATISHAAVLRTPYVADPTGTEAAHRGRVLEVVGDIITAAAGICLLAAALRREGGYYLIVLLVLIFDLLSPAIS